MPSARIQYTEQRRKHPHKPVIDFINDIFNPMEKVEKQIAEFKDELNRKLSAIYNLVSKAGMTTGSES